MSIPAFSDGLLVSSLAASLQVLDQAKAHEVIQLLKGGAGKPRPEVIAPAETVRIDVFDQVPDRDMALSAAGLAIKPIALLLQTFR